ncbi:MAG: Cyclopropane-fatty-acyl-phospholipid synthase, plant type [uncultured Arthrobacter sp.]|uniref:Cyclopropane-fatty-acyl-phospholipid synthase, plant type n=1 Tax=uncultured Arthrobacter sp. TaxID=114050 RepID=A0A6J4JEN8_9MICC|nr:class I SAM-dependent methyltransferase [uncultured Arthrobacter sp.]CAA9276838.1 MAG: Cyclopropane-fatty-acyl-phospholipid synthase, plant type [uncultured Arthrobacter sp.]
MSTPAVPSEARVDAAAWPDVAVVPAGIRTRAAGAVAERIFTSTVRGLPLRVVYDDGTVLGGAPESDGAPEMRIHRPADFYARLGRGWLIGFGESYLAEDWTAEDLTAVLQVFAEHAVHLGSGPLGQLSRLHLPRRPGRERNSQTNARANVSHHYDLSNDLFALFLDETMSYSSALFDAPVAGLPPAGPDDLAAAQRRKIDRLLDRARVGEGTRLLEIGTGWGELALRAAARGADVVSVTLSTEQKRLAEERVAAAGFADRVRVELKDYRAVEGEYDAVVSVEMIEAVGYEYWPVYFQTLDRLLAPGGRAAIQAITLPHERMLASRRSYTWIHKYIFPGGFIPSVRAIEEITARETGLRVRERFAMGDSYASTLRLWEERFTSRHDEVTALGFDETFERMWRFYLCYSRAGFQAGYLDVQQFLFDRRP